MKPIWIASLLCLLLGSSAIAQVERVWLTHKSNDPSRLVVSWMTTEPGESVVRFGTSPDYGQEVRVEGNRTLHHVEIPLTEKDTLYHYSVRTGDQVSEDATFKAYPTDRERPPRQAGPRPPRDERDLVLIADLDDTGDLPGRGREQDDVRDLLLDDVPIAFIDEQLILGGDQAIVADDVAELLQECAPVGCVATHRIGREL
jgi:hypothetical protein